MTRTEIERLAIVEERVRNIEVQVSNHLPSQIQALQQTQNLLETKLNNINNRLAYAAGALAVIIVIVNFVASRWGL